MDAFVREIKVTVYVNIFIIMKEFYNISLKFMNRKVNYQIIELSNYNTIKNCKQIKKFTKFKIKKIINV